MSFLLALTFLFTPAYALRFNLFGFPTNFLMVWVVLVWIVFIAWLIVKKQGQTFSASIASLGKKVLILIFLFFLSGLISLFIKGFDRAKFGQFIVLFLQPISLFFITGFTIKQQPKTKSLLLTACYLLLAVMGLYAIIQYFTLFGLPPEWWGNSAEPRRALGFFGHPNFYALFSAPLLAFLLPDLFQNLKSKISRLPAPEYAVDGGQVNLKSFAWLLGAAGLFLSLSRAGWLGLFAAIMVYLFVAADKKIRRLALVGITGIILIVALVPNWRYRVLLPFYGEKSSVSRLSLWQTGWKGVKESPLIGLGLTGFANAWPTLNTDPGLASVSHNFPHNIFLDLWVETGLLGLVSMVILIGLYIYRGLRRASLLVKERLDGLTKPIEQTQIIRLSISLFLIALLFQGLIDNPYFKNDLAMVFWMVLSFI